jgi:hypothetical protein
MWEIFTIFRVVGFIEGLFVRISKNLNIYGEISTEMKRLKEVEG